jgi:hypothetical protein
MHSEYSKLLHETAFTSYMILKARNHSAPKSTVDMSESDLSLPDDESSFHPSDYSESSIDDRPVLVTTSAKGDKAISYQSPIQKFQPEVVSRPNPTDHVTRKVQNFNNINVSVSGSSGGSPWVDDTGSSSSTSSDASKSRILLSISERIRFDEARQRLKQAQKRPRSAPQNRVQHCDSSASVSTGRHPLKPIDVTDAHDILTATPFSEKVRYACQRYEDARCSAPVKSKEIFKIKNAAPKSRIIGVLPSIIEGQDLKMPDRNRNVKASARPVPPIVVPEFCCPADDISSLGGIVSYNKGNGSNHRSHSARGDENDLERGNTFIKSESESCATIGWIEQRTNLELCLLFSVATSSVALLALLTVISTR